MPVGALLTDLAAEAAPAAIMPELNTGAGIAKPEM
jgi:hypothetical protein